MNGLTSLIANKLSSVARGPFYLWIVEENQYPNKEMILYLTESKSPIWLSGSRKGPKIKGTCATEVQFYQS